MTIYTHSGDLTIEYRYLSGLRARTRLQDGVRNGSDESA